MAEKPRMNPVKIALAVVLVLVVGAAGVMVGHLIRNRSLASELAEVTMPAPTSLLRKGDAFPDVVLLPKDGTPVRTAELLGPGGGVVLFLDLECPPCTDMAVKWQAILDEGAAGPLTVLGVTNHPLHIIEGYVSENGIRFPVVADTAQVFLRAYEVDRFPLEVVVSRSGRILSVSYDASRVVDPRALRQALDE